MPTTAVRSICLILLLCLYSCGTTRRFGNDVLLTVTSPAVVLYNAAVDSAATSREAGDSTDSGIVHAVTLPFAFAWHCVEHTVYCGAHAIDAALCPLYGVIEVGPTESVIEPLDIYDGLVIDRGPYRDLDESIEQTDG